MTTFNSITSAVRQFGIAKSCTIRTNRGGFLIEGHAAGLPIAIWLHADADDAKVRDTIGAAVFKARNSVKKYHELPKETADLARLYARSGYAVEDIVKNVKLMGLPVTAANRTAIGLIALQERKGLLP